MIKYAVFEFLGDYQIDHQPLWSERFPNLYTAVKAALKLYKRRIKGDWEEEIEAKPSDLLYTSESYHIVVMASNPENENAFEDFPVWAMGCMPEIRGDNV